MERKYGKGGKWLGVFFIIIVFVILVVVNISHGPSPEDLKKFNDLKVESEQLETMQKDIWEKEGEILVLQEKLKSTLRGKEKRELPVKLGTLNEKKDSLKNLFEEKLKEYQKKKEALPRELSDSLKVFK